MGFILYFEIVEYLVSQGADIHAQNNKSIINVSEKGNLKLVKYLVSQGANIHVNNNKAIRWASSNGHLEVVKYLLSQKTNINIITHAVRCASNYSKHWGEDLTGNHLEVIKYLVEQGAPTLKLSQRTLKYLAFCQKIRENNRKKTQKIIYYWWIPICYDLSRRCGQRMAQRSVDEYKKML